MFWLGDCYRDGMAGPRGEYRKSAERRAQILDAAFDVFSRNGYSAGSVNEIARTVGITQTGVLHHFAGGKIELLRAVVDQRFALAEQILGESTGREFLARLVEINRSQVRQRGLGQLARIVSAEASDPDHPAHEYFQERSRRILAAITAAYATVDQEGGLRPGTTPRQAAIRSLAMTQGLEQLWLDGVELDLAEEMRGYMSGFLTEPL